MAMARDCCVHVWRPPVFMEDCNNAECNDDVQCEVILLHSGMDLARSDPQQWAAVTRRGRIHFFQQLAHFDDADMPAPTATATGARGVAPLTGEPPGTVMADLPRSREYSGGRLVFRVASGLEERSLAYGEAAMWVGNDLIAMTSGPLSNHEGGAGGHGGAPHTHAGLVCSGPLPANERSSWQWRKLLDRDPVAPQAKGIRQHSGVLLSSNYAAH